MFQFGFHYVGGGEALRAGRSFLVHVGACSLFFWRYSENDFMRVGFNFFGESKPFG
jgi:hypothetical protein